MEAWLQLDDLHQAASAIATSEPDGHVSDADLRPPIPAPRSVFAVGLNYRSHAEESDMDLPKRRSSSRSSPAAWPAQMTRSSSAEAPMTTKQSSWS